MMPSPASTLLQQLTLSKTELFALLTIFALFERAARGQRAKAVHWRALQILQGKEASPKVERIYRDRLLNSPNFLNAGILVELFPSSAFPVSITLPLGRGRPIVFGCTVDDLVDLHPKIIQVLKAEPLVRGELRDELCKRFMVMLREASSVTTGRDTGDGQI